jgi:hypothetical protein
MRRRESNTWLRAAHLTCKAGEKSFPDWRAKAKKHVDSSGYAKEWDLKPDSAQPTAGLFAMSAQAIADSLASKEVSPQGPASGMRLLTFYLSHSAKRLSPSRLRSLEKARKILAARLQRELRRKTAAWLLAPGQNSPLHRSASPLMNAAIRHLGHPACVTALFLQLFAAHLRPSNTVRRQACRVVAICAWTARSGTEPERKASRPASHAALRRSWFWNLGLHALPTILNMRKCFW